MCAFELNAKHWVSWIAHYVEVSSCLQMWTTIHSIHLKQWACTPSSWSKLGNPNLTGLQHIYNRIVCMHWCRKASTIFPLPSNRHNDALHARSHTRSPFLHTFNAPPMESRLEHPTAYCSSSCSNLCTACHMSSWHPNESTYICTTAQHSQLQGQFGPSHSVNHCSSALQVGCLIPYSPACTPCSPSRHRQHLGGGIDPVIGIAFAGLANGCVAFPVCSLMDNPSTACSR